MHLLSGHMLLCVEPFFIFTVGSKYYCTHVDEKHFFVANKGSQFNVNYIKVPFSFATKFKILV